jgi:hypothetical protein
MLVMIVVTATWNPFNAKVFKPGDLATPHAQILAGTLTSERCASCHPKAATSPQQWFSSEDVGHANVSQTDRCLDCHHTTIDRSTAKLAHNLPRRTRAELRLASTASEHASWHDLLPGPAVDQENVDCSACHREHRGANGDLLAISDSQCQTCHSERFGSFATSHPDWDRWPYGRDETISFNHASHASKHFPSTSRGSTVAQFQCADCHTKTDDNELTRSTSYERACKSCHDDALRIEAADGIELLALPTLPTDSANSIKPWPESATGFHDGKLSAIAELLMRSDAETLSAIRRLPERDFSQISERDTVEVEAAETIAVAHRRLLQDIAVGGQHVIVDRATTTGVAPSTLSSFVQSLSPQLISEANRRWFGASGDRGSAASSTPDGAVRQTQYQDISFPPSSILLAARPNSENDDNQSADNQNDDDELLLTPIDSEDDRLSGPSSGDGDDLLGADDLLGQDPLSDPLIDDPLNDDPLDTEPKSSPGTPELFDADTMMPSGGWYRDDLRLAIRYRGGGHEDPVLRSTIELISQLSPGDPVRASLLRSRVVSACVACHPGAARSKGNWQSQPLVGRNRDLTKFSHGPHLNVAQLADCSHCHRVESRKRSEVNLTSGMVDVHDFAPLGREACAACHTPQAAGDACIKCHRYHINLR